MPALALSPAVCLDVKTKAKTRPESSATILSELEIFDSPTYAFTTTPTSDEPSDQKEDGDDDDSPSASPSTRSSISTPTTPKQYGIGRRVLSGSGSGSDFDFIGSNSKRLSVKKDSTGIEKKSQLSLEPESASDSIAEKNGNVQQLDKPSADEGGSEVHQVHPTETRTRTQTPSPTPRRRVKSDDTIPNAGAAISRRATHHEKHRESHPEWTLFLGIPRNAAPPQPPASVLFSNGESTVTPDLASIPAPAMTQRHSLLTTHLLAPTMVMRNRTKSDSALLASASAPAPGGAEEHGDGKNEVTSKTVVKRGEEDWTLSLPLVVSPTSPSSASSAEVLRGSKQHSDAPSGSGSQPVVEEECQPKVGEVNTQEGLVITVEDVDKGKQKRRQVPVRRSEELEEDNQDPLILRVPRIVRSCSSYPVLSATATATATTSSTHDIHSRLKKSSSTKWMGTGATSTPNLGRGVSSCTLEEEVLSMLLSDSATDEVDNESQPKSQPKLSKKDLAKKKMATLDEDLARFNALLKNGSQSGTGSRPVSTIIENAVAAAAAAAATASPSPPVITKTKAVTLNSHPDPIPTPTTFSSPPSLKKKSTSSQTLPILKPALKHVKSCEPFLESSDGGVVHSPPLSMGPVMRFPSSTGRGDLNFFDELGRGDGGHDEKFKPSRASLRLTKSAEWIMGDDALTALGLPAPVPAISASASPRASPSPPPVAQQQRRTSRSNSLLMTSTAQTPLLPFAHYNTKFASSPPSTSNLTSKGSLGRFDMSGSRGGVPTTMSFRAVSMGSISSNTTGPFESTSGNFFFNF